jgi:hypothetical protein
MSAVRFLPCPFRLEVGGSPFARDSDEKPHDVSAPSVAATVRLTLLNFVRLGFLDPQHQPRYWGART